MAVPLEAECRMGVFAGKSELSLVCWPQQRVGRRLIAALSAAIPKGAVVGIEFGGSFLFGEVSACWQEGEIAHASIELQEVLSAHA